MSNGLGPAEWLVARGADRKQALELGASLLLSAYRQRYEALVPIDLELLAESLNTKVTTTRDISGEACILPRDNGYEILLNAKLPRTRARSVVAHELGHILFFARREDRLVRLVGSNPALRKKEENFCFDLARYLLAPSWMLQRVGIHATSDPEVAFGRLHWTLRLSKDVAAQVLLNDRRLFVGIADRWQWRNLAWQLLVGNCYAHPSLRRRKALKDRLRNTARNWLNEQKTCPADFRVLCFPEKANHSAFVIVVVSPSNV